MYVAYQTCSKSRCHEGAKSAVSLRPGGQCDPIPQRRRNHPLCPGTLERVFVTKTMSLPTNAFKRGQTYNHDILASCPESFQRERLTMPARLPPGDWLLLSPSPRPPISGPAVPTRGSPASERITLVLHRPPLSAIASAKADQRCDTEIAPVVLCALCDLCVRHPTRMLPAFQFPAPTSSPASPASGVALSASGGFPRAALLAPERRTLVWHRPPQRCHTGDFTLSALCALCVSA